MKNEPLALTALVLLLTTGASHAAPAPDSLTEDDAARLALQANPTLAQARHERNLALIEADRSKPGFHPEVSATASQVLRGPRVDLPGHPSSVVLPNSLSRLEVDLKQPVFQFGVGKAPQQRVTASIGAARAEFRKAELDAALQAREAYLGLERAQALAGVARRGVELAGENLRVSRLLNERGLQADVDVLEAERAQSESDSRVLQAENGAALARANLNRLLGRSPDQPVAVAPSGPLPPAPGALAELAPLALRQRPEAEALRQNILAAEAGVRLVKSASKPRVNLEAGYALQTKTALTDTNNVYGGLSITAPLFDTSNRRAETRSAEERLAQARDALKALEGGIALEIEQQRLAIVEARARRDVAERTVAAAEKAYEITRARMERGRAVQVEVLNSRLNLERALGDRAAAENDLRLGWARLRRALGEGPAGEPADKK